MKPIILIPKNTQQAFDIGVRHLRSMTERSGNFNTKDPWDEKCLYRSPDGNRCVIGAMIPDDQYNPCIDESEFSNIMYLREEGSVLISEDIDVMVLHDLQRCHDDEENWGPDGFTGIGILRNIARRYNISSSILDLIYLEEQESES